MQGTALELGKNFLVLTSVYSLCSMEPNALRPESCDVIDVFDTLASRSMKLLYVELG